MIDTPTLGPQWQALVDGHYREHGLADLAEFKSNAINDKISLWNPQTNGLRYLRELIGNLCRQLTPKEWALLCAMRGREIGAPHSIRFQGETVCLDSLQAVFELCFLDANAQLNGANILEIGAGYGRTCHALLSNKDIASYTIVDIPLMLDLAARYLPQVLPVERFNRIRFIPLEAFPKLSGERFDLCLNIDSFAEMEEEVVRHYLAFIAARCDKFYTKNPVGKYLSKGVSPDAADEALRLAMSSGILRDIVDIYDDQAVELQAKKFVQAYCPATDWHCKADAWGRPWSYYWQAMYTRGSGS